MLCSVKPWIFSDIKDISKNTPQKHVNKMIIRKLVFTLT